jgi:hypothetical protein
LKISAETHVYIQWMMVRLSFAQHGSVGQETESEANVIEKIAATKMYFEEVAPMIVVVGGRSRVMGIKGITLKIVSV